MSKKLSEFLPKAFHTTWKVALNSNILHVVEKGGRGSGKSSGIAHIIVQLIMRYPVNAVAIRYVDNTIELSIFEQIKWAIEEQGVSKYFKVNKSPMKITYKPRGNYIVFRGAQNPERIKSLKDSRFPFAIAWIEELAEFKTEDDVKTITNSLLRGELADGLFYKFFYSYNPPKRRQSWVNKKYESSFQPENTFVHHSTYKDNPFIAQAFIEEVNATRAKNPKRAEWEYDGKAIGSGVVPFDNLRVIKGCITDEMAANFDNIRNGLDFGYATDPLAFVRWHYDKKKNGIYALQVPNTPFLSYLLGAGKVEAAKSTEIKWREYGMNNDDSSAQLEGGEYADAESDRTWFNNYTEIFRKSTSVSGTLDAINVDGVGNELNSQVLLKVQVKNMCYFQKNLFIIKAI